MERYAFRRNVALRAAVLFFMLLAASGCARPSGMLWSARNLDVDRYRNGDPVPEARTEEEWHDAASKGEGAWCRSDGADAPGSRCGRLYNWYAVHDPRGLAPEGWHVASGEEWDRAAAEPGALRRLSISFCGSRNCLGSFYGAASSAFFWTADSSGAFEAWDREVWREEPQRIVLVKVARSLGLSVRCVRDRKGQ
ncbi:fibrobacter succinogenes major paralogous domain-containing protein [Chlorobium sp. N1]|uniref:FISUMP domain-containing protein n=1 Tax=Chlorobium sp. N1 TaxID=2491138 RepID=UPI001040C45B|nr:fibrobacter succinogenes major paralogous domain-containing protein [Chlorobium sp. N1]TCD48783.1 hypothetical protein E0L29_02560 [Chlorobium sp. N1]